jgi:tetratricopeptide (TPR) repeat protein
VRLAFFYQHLNQLAKAERLLQENLAFHQEGNGTEETAFIHNILGDIAWKQGGPNKAAAHYRASLRICCQIKAPQIRADALCGLSKSLFDLGQQTAATFYAEKSLHLRREMRDSWGVAVGLNNLSHIAEAQGHYAQAATLLYEAMVTAHLVGARWLGGVLQHNIAYIESIEGNDY